MSVQWGGYPRRTLKESLRGYFKKSSIGDSKGDYIEDLRMEGDLFNSFELDTDTQNRSRRTYLCYEK